jgi:DNA mismatch repair protein MutS
MYHLKVTFNEITGALIYDRHLEPGAGNPTYGLEVAKAMDLDRDFIDLANNIRKDLLGLQDTIVSTKKSKYNSEVYLDRCAIPGCSNPAELTHHIKFQADADPQGFLDQHLQKNHRSNLIGLCRMCHSMVHDDQPGHWRYQIKGYQMTTHGPVLDYCKIQNLGGLCPPIAPLPNPQNLGGHYPSQKIILKLKPGLGINHLVS